MSGRLANKVAIVTGAAQGIGRAYALELAKEGAKVSVSDVVEPVETVAAIKEIGGEAIGVVADITSNESLEKMVSATKNAFGRADILVNNAALFGALRMGSYDTLSEDEWDRVMKVNVRGTWQTIKAVVPLMKRSGGGKIINISSATVFKGTAMLLHYVTSKGAIVALTRSIARELSDSNICVNAIAPGLVASANVKNHADWTKVMDSVIATRAIKRESVPEDILGALIFFASDDCNFITGQTLVVDGGVVMH